MNGEGLADFGTGLFGGASVGAKVFDGSPVGVIGGGILGGALSYFGGAPQRRLEKRANEQALALGDLEVTDARRKSALDEQRRRQREMFGKMLSQYFQQGTA